MGRPRSFDVDQALDRAMNVFWRKGYEGTSLADLTKAMRINRPSLYAAFGNKEALFRKAMDRYTQGPACHITEAIQEPTARAVAERFWRAGIELVSDPRHPRGCFMVQSALACGNAAEPVRREMAEQRGRGEALLRKRFKRAIVEGDLPASTDPGDLARYVTAVAYGMAVQAAGGATRAELKRVAEAALRAWPK